MNIMNGIIQIWTKYCDNLSHMREANAHASWRTRTASPIYSQGLHTKLVKGRRFRFISCF